MQIPNDAWPWLLIVPFLGLIVSLAILQAAAPVLWHRHERKIVAAWSLTTLAMIAGQSGWPKVGDTLITTALTDYLPFFTLLAALYIVAGGIRVTGDLQGNPITNLLLILVGGLLASLVGTTGSSMIMIRPLIRANRERVHNAHVVLFFIFIAANIGGALTPLGDPPLLIGYLHGVAFFWTTRNLIGPTLFVVACVGVIFLAIDWYFYRSDKAHAAKRLTKHRDESVSVQGWLNVGLMLVIIAAVPSLGAWQQANAIEVGGPQVGIAYLTRMGLLLVIAGVSVAATPGAIRAGNGFTWRPITEVGVLFAGVFITLAPLVEILHDGRDGAFAPLAALVSHADGSANPTAYFWLSGLISASLDNAPTYLAFFDLAGGDAKHLMASDGQVLIALSCGCVFMGALTYIGNAPNMMVRSIAVESGIRMPGFLTYSLWSCTILLPIFALVTLVFFP